MRGPKRSAVSIPPNSTRACGGGSRRVSHAAAVAGRPRARRASMPRRISRQPSPVLTLVPSVWNATSPAAVRTLRSAWPLRPRSRPQAPVRPGAPFSAASAWAGKAASTARRASSRTAGTARASTRARTWPSGAASALGSSCWARKSVCSTRSAGNGVGVRNERGFRAVPWGVRAARVTPADPNYQKRFLHPARKGCVRGFRGGEGFLLVQAFRPGVGRRPGWSLGLQPFTDRCAKVVKFSQGPNQPGQRRIGPDAVSGEGERQLGGIARAIPPSRGTRRWPSGHP